MSGTKADLIKYRIERAEMTLDSAQRMIDAEWLGVANRLYYSICQIISALMTQEEIRIKSHSGAKAMFELHFIKSGKIEPKWGKLYTRLSDARHESDYAPYASFSQEDIAPLLPQTREFIDVVKRLINTL